MGYPVVHDLAVVLQLQMKNTSFRPAPWDELLRKCAHELISVLPETPRETVNSKIQSSQILHSGVIAKHTDISLGSKT